MSITATELKMNLGKYLLMAEKEDIYITRNGKIVAKLSNPYQDRVDVAKSLFGIIPDEMTLEEARDEFHSKTMRRKFFFLPLTDSLRDLSQRKHLRIFIM